MGVDLYGLLKNNNFGFTRDAHNRYRGFDTAFRDMAFSLLTSMGGRTIPMNNSKNPLAPAPMMGEWEDLSLTRIRDLPKIAYRAAFPYHYDLQHLPADTPRDMVSFAEGRANFEKALMFTGFAKGLQALGGRGISSRALTRNAIRPLVTREVNYSGIPLSGSVSAVEEGVTKSGRNRFTPDSNATGAHSVFRRGSTGRVTHYETYRPQTNPYDPRPWESIKRYDGPGGVDDKHYNKFLKKYIDTPHIHDPHTPGGVRFAEQWEIPNW